MLQSIFNYFGQLDIYGLDPIIVASFGFMILLFGISEFFRLVELLIVRIFGKR